MNQCAVVTGESKNKRGPAVASWLDLILVMLLPAALYLSTLARTLTWAHGGQDGGDLIAAVFISGVPHPPGYPTYASSSVGFRVVVAAR